MLSAALLVEAVLFLMDGTLWPLPPQRLPFAGRTYIEGGNAHAGLIDAMSTEHCGTFLGQPVLCSGVVPGEANTVVVLDWCGRKVIYVLSGGP